MPETNGFLASDSIAEKWAFSEQSGMTLRVVVSEAFRESERDLKRSRVKCPSWLVED